MQSDLSSTISVAIDWESIVRRLVHEESRGQSDRIVLGVDHLPSTTQSVPQLADIPSVRLWVKLPGGYQRGGLWIPEPEGHMRLLVEKEMIASNISDIELYITALNSTKQWKKLIQSVKKSIDRIRQAGTSIAIKMKDSIPATKFQRMIQRYLPGDFEFPGSYYILLRQLSRNLVHDTQ